MGMIKSKLKRRLRKKFHVGEFQESGFEIFVNLKSDLSEIEFDKFLDEFIGVIEENKLLFGGGRKDWEGFITSAKKFASPAVEDREKIKIWLEKREEVIDCKVGHFLDAWNDSKWND
jgi:uncharacterized protein YggL (DUF469 family)